MEQPTATHRSMRRALTSAMAAAALFGLAGGGAIALTDETAVAPCRASETDLLRAADAARQLEAERPELFEGGTRARFDDLRLAAEWARRLESLVPGLVC